MTDITAQLLAEWPLPEPADSKYGRGQIVVVGGAARSAGAVLLAGVAALRVGAGRLTLALASSVAAEVAVAVPECGVVPLKETRSGAIDGGSLDAAAPDLANADAVLLGPGLDDASEAERMLAALPSLIPGNCVVVLDAFALGALPKARKVVKHLGGRLILTPNRGEAARLLGSELGDLADGLAQIAARYQAVATCYGVVAHPDGRTWMAPESGNGLATSGSGDVLAGAVTGLAARGADPAQAAAWATWLHIQAGTALEREVGPVGYLAGELAAQFPRLLTRP